MRESEQLVIACMFYEPEESMQTVIDSGATSSWFRTHNFGYFFDSILLLYTTNQDFTLINLADKLKTFPCGPAMSAFLGDIPDSPIPAVQLKPALKKLAKAAALRSMSDLSEQIRYAVEHGNDTTSLVEELARRQAAVPDSLTIYGVDRLVSPGQVLIFFSKSEAKLAERLLPGIIPLATTTNIKKLSGLNLSLLSGRKVIIWRGDNQPASDHLYHLLTKAGASGVRVVRSPSEQARNFGLSDADLMKWTIADCFAYIKKNLYDPAAEDEETEPVTTGGPVYDDGDDGPLPDFKSAPFQCLGYDHGTYYYLPNGSNQVIPLRAGEHSKSHLITLAPLQHWEDGYPGSKGANWDAAMKSMIQFQHKQGVYDPARLRGRGAWEDECRSVLHLGNTMYVDGSVMLPRALSTRFIYEAAAAMEYDRICEPLATRNKGDKFGTEEFIKLCDLATWERPIYGRLMAGWCVIAPICGALAWRPHVHVTGKSGSGKSSIMNYIVAPIVGKAALSVKGAATSAAGIRQSLGCDARPVIHDEFEGEDPEMQRLIKGVLELARGCSSDDEAGTVKGGADGKAKLYRTRSAFCFSSIGVNMTQASDISRISVLSLGKPEGWTEKQSQEHYDRIKTMWETLLTEEYCCAFRSRMVRLIPVIRKNALTFSRAAATGIGTQRTGDQVGSMLAGAYALTSTQEVTPTAARDFIESQDWSEYRAAVESADENRCLSKILETVVRVQGRKGSYDLNVGELIHIANVADGHEGVSQENADDTLKRHGIRVQIFEGVVCISNTHDALKKWLEKTPWNNNWRQFLGRLPGAEKRETMRFSPGSPGSKAVALPLSMLGEG